MGQTKWFEIVNSVTGFRPIYAYKYEYFYGGEYFQYSLNKHGLGSDTIN